MTSYVSSDMIAQTYQMMRDLGIFDSHAKLKPGEIQTGTGVHLDFITGTLGELAQSIFGVPLANDYIGTSWETTTGIVGIFDGNPVILTNNTPGINVSIYDDYTITTGSQPNNLQQVLMLILTK